MGMRLLYQSIGYVGFDCKLNDKVSSSFGKLRYLLRTTNPHCARGRRRLRMT